jgi:hypothetical protein
MINTVWKTKNTNQKIDRLGTGSSQRQPNSPRPASSCSIWRVLRADKNNANLQPSSSLTATAPITLLTAAQPLQAGRTVDRIPLILTLHIKSKDFSGRGRPKGENPLESAPRVALQPATSRCNYTANSFAGGVRTAGRWSWFNTGGKELVCIGSLGILYRKGRDIAYYTCSHPHL